MTTRLPAVPPELAALGVGLRPEHAGDGDFAAALYASTRWEELAPTAWSDAEKHGFLRQQFQLQDAHYRRAFAAAARGIITSAAQPVGRLYLLQSPGDLRIVDISLLPAHRGRGIGGRLVRAVLDQGRDAGTRVSIHVEPANPARRLYHRLGFSTVEDGAFHVLMEWRPS